MALKVGQIVGRVLALGCSVYTTGGSRSQETKLPEPNPDCGCSIASQQDAGRARSRPECQRNWLSSGMIFLTLEQRERALSSEMAKMD